jgi:putative transposase
LPQTLGGSWRYPDVNELNGAYSNVERKLRNFLGHKFWARGYFVSTVGRDEEMIRAYIKNQELADKDQMQLKLASS